MRLVTQCISVCIIVLFILESKSELLYSQPSHTIYIYSSRIMSPVHDYLGYRSGWGTSEFSVSLRVTERDTQVGLLSDWLTWLICHWPETNCTLFSVGAPQIYWRDCFIELSYTLIFSTPVHLPGISDVWVFQLLQPLSVF